MSEAHYEIEALIRSRVAMAAIPPQAADDIRPGLHQCRAIDAVVDQLLGEIGDRRTVHEVHQVHQVHLMLVMDALFGPIP